MRLDPRRKYGWYWTHYMTQEKHGMWACFVIQIKYKPWAQVEKKKKNVDR